MNTKEMISQLRLEASKNPALNAVLHVFACRQRARSTLDVKVLERRMVKEGFKYASEEYVKILRLLGGVGIGKLDTDPKGRVRALKDIKITFQSLGLAVYSGNDNELKTFKQRNKFVKLPIPTNVKLEDIKVVGRPKVISGGSNITLTVSVGSKAVSIPVPKDLTPEEITELVARFRHSPAA